MKKKTPLKAARFSKIEGNSKYYPKKRILYQRQLLNTGLGLSTGVIVIARSVGWTKVPKGIYPIIQLFLLCQAQYCIVLRSMLSTSSNK